MPVGREETKEIVLNAQGLGRGGDDMATMGERIVRSWMVMVAIINMGERAIRDSRCLFKSFGS